jgi:hypothetical protein
MEKGVRLDNAYGGVATESWVPEGYFKKNQKVTTDFFGGKFKSMGKYVSSYACSKCGFIESYIESQLVQK